MTGFNIFSPERPFLSLIRLVVDGQQISAQLDNVVMVAAAIQMLRQGFQGTVFFSAGEEAGRSWRYLVEWFQRSDAKTDRLLVLDTSPFPVEDVGNQDVVLRNQDANGTFDGAMTQRVRGRCDQLEISYCFKDEYIAKKNLTNERQSSLGRTELGRVIGASGGSISGTTLQLPTTAYHHRVRNSFAKELFCNARAPN